MNLRRPASGTPGEHLWAIRKDGQQLDCELRDHGQWGVEVQIYGSGNFSTDGGGRPARWHSRKPTIRRRRISARAAS